MMKLICLNTWGGRIGLDQLVSFFAEHRDTDIFCLQEVWNGGEYTPHRTAAGRPLAGMVPELLVHIRKTLPSHTAYFRPQLENSFGLTMMLRADIPVKAEGDFMIYRKRGYVSSRDLADHGRNLQHATIQSPAGPRTIMHCHALWNGNGKTDSPARLRQSDTIARFARTIRHPYILCGDFNLLPDTKSMQKLEALGLRNLITEYGITSTRTSHYDKEVGFADYVLVSKGITVNRFRVLPDEISDHAPLMLDFT